MIDLTALILSRMQFAFTVSFHIIFLAFTIGPAAWLTFSRPCISGPDSPCTGFYLSSG